MATRSPQGKTSDSIILYDGVCGLCNKFNLFVLRRDEHNLFRFASLQSRFAKEVLARHGASPEKLDTVYLIADYGQAAETVLSRSEAVIFVLAHLASTTRVARVLQLLPKLLVDGIYDFIAGTRYRLFGRLKQCPLPNDDQRKKFIEV